ncbi:MAG TPA: protein kinase [Vicinamibacterales bacterium]|nr:protein kinase [Vicinamibacterales bacterium]
MSLTTGTKLGSFEVGASIGEGGMGQVYRARDTKLGREVALKVLPPSLAGDPDRLARFHREAQVLAALNHPNIAQIYGFEQHAPLDDARGAASESRTALIMELVEGPTLADRIEHGALPVDEALNIARQIATALEAAHEQGIVHRDLKPANVKVKEDGTVKVLDFGLAKALDPAAGPGGDVTNSPTLTARSTQLGTILGTAAYMAPEQAKGKAVDKRADIWAFGVVLFEMIAGQRAFKGDDVSDVLAAVLRQEIDWSALPPSTPANVKRVLARCLERDPKKRLRDIGDVWIGMDVPEPQAAPAAAVAPEPKRSSFLMRALPWAAAILVAAGSWAWISANRTVAEPHPVTRAMESIAATAAFTSVSPDGTKLVYAMAGEKGTINLALRNFDEFASRLVPGTDGGTFATFSPDGESLAFSGQADGKIRKIATSGGTSVPICDGSLQNGGAWGEDNTLIFPSGKGLMRVSVDGGTPEPITSLDAAAGETAHSRPQFLPGGRRILFTVTKADGRHFAVHDLGTPGHRIVARGGINGKYVASGHLTFVRGTTLTAVPFDLSRMEVTGSEVPIVENVSVFGPTGTGDYSVSSTGLLAYISTPKSDGTILAWADRAGKTTPLAGQSRQAWGTGRLSTDGRLVVNAIENSRGGRDIWTYDVNRGTLTQLTFGSQADVNDLPVFSSDGKHVYYSGIAEGKRGIYSVPADASGKPSLLLAVEGGATPTSASTDGKWLLYHQPGADKRTQIMVLDLTSTGTAQPKPLHEAVAAELGGVFSRDGKWVAYQSVESGLPEIYVIPFPGPGAKTKVSLEGGAKPRWTIDGKELLYWANAPTERLMTVGFSTTSGFVPGQPQELFRQLSTTTWDVSPDRNKFLVELSSRNGATMLALVTNWFEELRKRVPAKK